MDILWLGGQHRIGIPTSGPWQYTSNSGIICQDPGHDLECPLVTEAQGHECFQVAFFHLCQTEQFKLLEILTMVTSGLDYSNFFYPGLPFSLTQKLGLIQNTATQIFTGSYIGSIFIPFFVSCIGFWLRTRTDSRFWSCPLKPLMVWDQCTFTIASPGMIQKKKKKLHSSNKNFLRSPTQETSNCPQPGPRLSLPWLLPGRTLCQKSSELCRTYCHSVGQ